MLSTTDRQNSHLELPASRLKQTERATLPRPTEGEFTVGLAHSEPARLVPLASCLFPPLLLFVPSLFLLVRVDNANKTAGTHESAHSLSRERQLVASSLSQ